MIKKLLRNWKAKAKLLKRDVYTLYLCSRHPKTPFLTKMFALLIVGYALSPIDLIPDFIPIFGYLDDLILIPLGIALLIKMIPKDVLKECRMKAQLPPTEKNIKWIGAVIVVSLWGLAIYVIYRLVKG